jgi:hypothetical protein
LELPEEVRCFYQAMPSTAEFVPIRLDAPHRVSQVARDCIFFERTVVGNEGHLHDEAGGCPPIRWTVPSCALCSGQPEPPGY